jgi:hypothetical protein
MAVEANPKSNGLRTRCSKACPTSASHEVAKLTLPHTIREKVEAAFRRGEPLLLICL